MGVDVDPARHHDHTFGVVNRIRLHARVRRLHDASIAYPDVLDILAAMSGVDHATAGDTYQHSGLSVSSSNAESARITSAADGASVLCDADFVVNVPIHAEYSTQSWSTPGWPTTI